MPGNLRKRGGTGRTERDYLRARRRVGRMSQICAHPECRQAIDMTLKPICQFVDTSNVPIGEAHLVPLVCGPECRELKHARKANPWSFSANHKVPVNKLSPEEFPEMAASVQNLEPMHLRCNQALGDRDVPKAKPKTSRDWFA